MSDLDPARVAALALLGDVLEGQRLLSEVLGPRLDALAPPDRARAQRLAVGTLRWMDRADRALGPFVRMKPWPEIHNILRLAIFEIYEGGTPAHAAVAAAVDLARATDRGAGQAGMVNGVLRNVERAGGWQALPLPRLPKWLRKPLLKTYGKEVVAAMEAAFADGAPVDLSVKDDPAGWAERLGGTVLPTGSVRLDMPGQISALPGFADGAWWVQDAAAAVPARALGDVAGARVLDMCAAPGGKTLQLAAAGAQVTALDLSEARMARVGENLARCGLAAEIVVADALDYAAAPFDAVLLDAPCSATGTLRRHPDLPRAKAAQDFAPLIALQARLLDRALTLVKPGGRVVFCTCSLLPEEGEAQVDAALARHPGLVLDRDALQVDGIDPAWIGAQGLRLRPDYWADAGGMDGFFVAAFRAP
ncbi:RsmB/NOP family class I SAM-dependent RNA methyltransferase [Maribius pontilimi]|uniref:RsmB/NOP family class I SAM-dependent RNA methyltransferase n=1 Tax=Palleronia pontilimi TaxID=1964209 RepID=A0A934IJL5_9RHOB|nr:RsmB/NOP family class I SAM-dependent RNA methyltransferase [Palleronia pontilimi]MBJ3764128.1 RsmB/NOP family class I SAM-dependent RNA methyltransferase [Palleronia pontilimi]